MDMNELSITVIQSNLHWENVDQNLAMFAQKLSAIEITTDLIVLPEMFNTGFSMESAKLAETMNGKTVTWMKEMAKKSNAAIIGSLIITENENYYNRLVWSQPNGECFTYDKRHLFRMADEDKSFSAGQERLIINYKGWRICPLVCYDLRFPVWSRNSDAEGKTAYDCLIYIANWPEARKAPWSKLLEARAIENQCYLVGVNRVGNDGKEIAYSGNSAIIDPKGEEICSFKESAEMTQTGSLSLKELNDFRAKFPVEMDADEFKITP